MVMDQLKIKLFVLVCLLALCIPCQAAQWAQTEGDRFDERVYNKGPSNGPVSNTGTFVAPASMNLASYYRDISERYEGVPMNLDLNNRPVMIGKRSPGFRFTKPNKASLATTSIYNRPHFDETGYYKGTGQGPTPKSGPFVAYFKDMSDYIRYQNEQMMHARPVIIDNKYPDGLVAGPAYPKTAEFVPAYYDRYLGQQYALQHSTRNNDFQDLTSYRYLKDIYLPYENIDDSSRGYYSNDFDARSQFAKIGYQKRYGVP